MSTDLYDFKGNICPGCGEEFCEMDENHHQCECGKDLSEQYCKEHFGLCPMCDYQLTK